MIFDLMIKYKKRQFKSNYYKQHPDGNDRQMEYYWRQYLANRCTSK